jgi:hypothetical protein
MIRNVLFRKSALVASLPLLLLLLMSAPACGDQGAHQEAGKPPHDTAPTKEAAAPSPISGIWAQISARKNAIASLLESNQLKGVHDEAEALETLGDKLAESSTMLDEAKLARVRGAANQMRHVAGSLHDAADKGDTTRARTEFQKLEGLLKLIEAQYPAGTLSSGVHQDLAIETS